MEITMGLTGFNKRRREAAEKAKLALDKAPASAEEVKKEEKKEDKKVETPAPVKEEVKEVSKKAASKGKTLRDE